MNSGVMEVALSWLHNNLLAFHALNDQFFIMLNLCDKLIVRRGTDRNETWADAGATEIAQRYIIILMQMNFENFIRSRRKWM